MQTSAGQAANRFKAAMAAHHRRDWQAAIAAWEEIRDETPHRPRAYTLGATALRQVGRLDEADALLAAASMNFPADADVLMALAQQAQRQGRWDHAETQWRAACIAAPDDWRPLVGHVRALAIVRRFNESESLFGSAASRFPNKAEVAIAGAVIAVLSNDWRLGARRWDAVCAQFADLPAGPIGRAGLHLARNEAASAEQVANAAWQRFPDAIDLAVLRARAAMALGHWPIAADRWRSILAAAPQSADAHAGLIEVLIAQRDFAEADRRLIEMPARLRSTAAILRAGAELAMRRGHLGPALDLWQTAHARFPDDKKIGRGLMNIRMRLADLTREADAGAMPGHDAAGLSPDRPPSELTADRTCTPERQHLQRLLSAFESLGDACEFGIVQRECGIEPLGLLRWSSIPLPELQDALQSRFAGVGQAAQTTLQAVSGEFVTKDRRFIMAMHTFIDASEADADLLFPKLCRRLLFLRDKLLEDLSEARKIFVYRSSVQHDDAAFRQLYDALCAYGPNKLLIVVRSNGTLPSGAIRELTPGCLVGALDHFHNYRPWVPGWLTLCGQAHAAFLPS